MANRQDLKDRIQALPPLRQLVESMNMRAHKSLGQNFLFDLSLTRRIARSSGTLLGTTIEVGPGPGGLTRALLLEGAVDLIAIEKGDYSIFPSETFAKAYFKKYAKYLKIEAEQSPFPVERDTQERVVFSCNFLIFVLTKKNS